MNWIGRYFAGFRFLLHDYRGVLFAIVSPDKKILMQLRDQNSKRFKGYWCIPGGKTETGEEPLDTVVREVKEEYELDVSKEACTHIYTRYFGRHRTYTCKLEGNQTPVMHEGADMKWMSIDEIEKLNLGFYNTEILPALKKYLKGSNT